MNVTVLFFASLREALGTGREQIDLPDGVATAGQLRAFLRMRGQAWEQALGEASALRVAVNQVMADPATPLLPGAEVAFFPPVTGG